MEIIESFTLGRRGARNHNEDAVVITPHHAAVVDGATDIGDRRYVGKTPGRFACEVLVETLGQLPPGCTADEAIDLLSTTLMEATLRAGGTPDAHVRPTATVACYSAQRHEVWRVGDAMVRIGSQVSIPHTTLDTLAAATRAAYDRALIATGMPLSRIATDDPGREVVLPVMHLQTRFQNDPAGFAEFGRGVIDGRVVPARFRDVWTVEPGTEVVLATDGYLSPAPTLAEAEAVLADLLERDPQRIDAAAPGLKGTKPGQISFDDRAYLRLRA